MMLSQVESRAFALFLQGLLKQYPIPLSHSQLLQEILERSPHNVRVNVGHQLLAAAGRDSMLRGRGARIRTACLWWRAAMPVRGKVTYRKRQEGGEQGRL